MAPAAGTPPQPPRPLPTTRSCRLTLTSLRRSHTRYGWRVIIASEEYVDLETPSGPMRTYVLSPAASGRYPGLVLFSEIFQVTGPIRRTAAFLAGHGYVVAVPEVYHELEPAGSVIAYDTAGADRGNAHKVAKPVSAYDADAKAALAHLSSRPDCTG